MTFELTHRITPLLYICLVTHSIFLIKMKEHFNLKHPLLYEG